MPLLKLGFSGPEVAKVGAIVAAEPKLAVLEAGGEQAGVTKVGAGNSLVSELAGVTVSGAEYTLMEIQRCVAITIGVVIGHISFTWGEYQD